MRLGKRDTRLVAITYAGNKYIRLSGFGVLAALLVLPAMQAASTPATTTTTLALSAAQVAPGTPVSLTASVAAAGPVTVGQVNFCDAAATYCTDIHLLGTAQLTSAGTAVLRFFPGIGSHSYKAVFSGTNSAATSASGESLLTVTGMSATTTTIAQSGSAGNYTLTATVAGAAVSLPTGTMSFLDTSNANDTLATAALGTVTTTLDLLRSWTANAADDAYGLGVGDFNGDGKADLAVPNLHNNTVTVMLGNGDGTFTIGATLPTGSQPISVAAGDFNGDGKADLAISNLAGNSVTIMLGNGDGTFTAAAPLPAGYEPQYVFLADFNGDGNLDIAVPNYGDNTVTVGLGHGDGTFTATTLQAPGGPDSLALGDLNGDGKTDMVIANYDANTLTVLLGNGDGTFTPMAPDSVPVGTPGCIVMGDFNGDGKADLAVLDSGSNTMTVLLGNGDGTFTPGQTLATGAYPVYLAVGDFNGDGKADLSLINQSNSNVMMLLGNGDGTFKLAATVATGYMPFQVAVADFNGDGIPDVVTGNDDRGQATVLLTQLTQSVTATATGISPTGAGTHLLKASYPGDGNYTASTSSTTGLTAQPVATTLTLNANPTSSTYGQQVLLTATLSPLTTQNQSTNGQIVSFYSGSTKLGTGTLSSGVATLNLTSLPAGTNSVTASFAGDTNFDASTSSAVSCLVSTAPAVTFAVQNHTYGDAAFMVSATSNSTGAITYSVVSGPATVSGSMVTLTGVGTVVLSANQAANGNYAAATQKASFTVAGSTPAIAFTAPNHTYGDAAFALSATSNSTGAITYAVISGPATISGSAVTLNGAGTVVLSANQAASGNYAAKTSIASIIVQQAASSTTLAKGAAPATKDGTIVLQAQVRPATSGTPTGSVRFFDGKVMLGESPLQDGVATFSTNLLQAGTVNPLVAVYQGDTNFVSSSSAALPVQLQTTGFWVAPASGLTSLSVQSGQKVVFPLKVGPGDAGVYPGVVSFSVTGLPAGATAVFSPATLAPESGAQTVSLTVQTAAGGATSITPATTGTLRQRIGPAMGGAVLALVLLPLTGARRLRKAGRGLALTLLLMVGAMVGGGMLAGCGVSRGSGWGAQAKADQQPTTYTLTVTMSSGGVKQSTTASLILQQ